jgi:hypothetical protein
MIAINRIKDVLPDISSIYAIPIYNIAGIDGDKISIKDENIIFKFDMANDSMSAEYEPVRSDSGELYQISITGFMPGESVANNKILNTIRKYKFMVIYLETDGTYRRTGSSSVGLDLDIKYQSSPNKGYKITFSKLLLEAPKPSQPYILKNNTPVTPLLGGAITE